MFCIFLTAVGLIVLLSFLFGSGVLRCFSLLTAGAARLHLRSPLPTVVRGTAH